MQRAAAHAKRFLEWAVRCHLPFLLLLAFLALHSLATFGTFVVSDDLAWVRRTAADAHKPWNVFVEPLFGNYYRPVPHLVWLANYYLWGFNFDGHQFMFILMWLGGVCLVYAVGYRIGGRLAGCAAAAIVGLNDVYLLIASWKSWYTTVTEFVVVLAWAWVTMKWLEERRRWCVMLSGVLAIVGLLSRELAPLIISAVVLVTVVLPAVKMPGFSRRRAIGWLITWAAVTAAALLVLPSYRSGLRALLFTAQEPSVSAGGAAKGVSAGYFGERFVSHARSIFDYGISRYLVWFAVLFAALRARRERAVLLPRYRHVLLGAYVAGAVLLALPWGARILGRQAQAVSTGYAQPAIAVVLMLLFCAVALAGDRRDRMLGAWFVASFAPALFLEHKSNAYHMLAFAALALFTARRLPVFVEEELRPAVVRLRGKAPAGADDDARYVLTGIFILLLLAQVLMLHASVRPGGDVAKLIQQRVSYGRAMESHVNRAIEGVLQNMAPDRRVWVAPEPYAELAGLVLQEKHGITVERLVEPGLVGLRTFDAALRVYTDAIPYDDALFARCNIFPNPGFEEEQPGLPRAPVGRSGKYSLASGEASRRPEKCVVESGSFALRPGVGYVFGGFVRREAESALLIRMALLSTGGARYVCQTPPAAQAKPEWELVWECAAPPAGSTRFAFRFLEAERVRDGRILVDDVFFCPVESLILAARGRR